MSSSAGTLVQVSRASAADGVAIITLDDGARGNACSFAMGEQLLVALEQLMYFDAGCRAIVLTGAGGVFCVGEELSDMQALAVLDQRERSRLAVRVFELMAEGPKPLVAAVEGSAIGAGLALAAVCDEVVGARDARLGADFGRLGLLPDTGLYWSLAQRVGAGRARELLMTGREIDAEEALRMGLATELVEPGGTLAAACVRARRYEAVPPLSVAHVRLALARHIGSLDDAIEAEADLQPMLRDSQDHKEAVAAFLGKRRPVFSGR
ncbi:MAG TPA: enoyl-CoA hydratase-related protein [Ramlibacter sp.]|nr:enoyl-CoA hydratase-related protein [Ramlibacter sp.]